jgi:hypothetical protein
VPKIFALVRSCMLELLQMFGYNVGMDVERRGNASVSRQLAHDGYGHSPVKLASRKRMPEHVQKSIRVQLFADAV